jgi:hypothetical protein
MKYAVTANQLRAHDPCPEGLALLETISAELSLDPDQPVDFNTVLDRGGFRYAVWALRTQPAELSQRVSIRFAKLTLPVWEAQYPDDLRPRQAIEAATACVADPSAANLRAAAHAAHAAAYAAAAGSATHAARAAHAAAYAAYVADATHAARAAYAAAYAAYVAARAADADAGVPEADLIRVFKEELS